MGIQWTPWFNVPIHRRLELFSTAFVVFLALGFPFVCSIFLLYLLVNFVIIEFEKYFVRRFFYRPTFPYRSHSFLVRWKHIHKSSVRAIFSVCIL